MKKPSKKHLRNSGIYLSIIMLILFILIPLFIIKKLLLDIIFINILLLISIFSPFLLLKPFFYWLSWVIFYLFLIKNYFNNIFLRILTPFGLIIVFKYTNKFKRKNSTIR